jgi:segregation and condensation protein A
VTDIAEDTTGSGLADPVLPVAEDLPPTDRVNGRSGGTGTAPRLSVAGFNGPLDRLLEDARARKIDLASLSIAALVEAFVAALQAALADPAGVRLEHWAVWTVTAATLTELWSRLKLPADSPEARAATAEAEALREQFASRALMLAAADWLEQRPHLGQDVFRRGRPQASATVRGGDLTDLLRACLPVLHVPEEQAAALRPRPPPLWTASDAMRRLAHLLPGLTEPAPLAAFLPRIDNDAAKRTLRCRVAVASTLFAGLELARNGALMLDQDADWTPIRVSRRERDVSGASASTPLA